MSEETGESNPEPGFPDGTPKILGAAKGSKGPEVSRLQGYLKRFGYLSDPDLKEDPFASWRWEEAPKATDGSFDDATEEGLRTFQRFYGLPETGQVDGPTVARMAAPRCGVPDYPVSFSDRAAGDRWPTNSLRFAVLNITPDLPASGVFDAMREALELWARVTPLSFTGVPVLENPEFLISFQSGDHGDGFPFDGGGGTLAHAFYPPPPPGSIRGDTHFDEAETWSLTVPSPPGTYDLFTVALHEFGHALGLPHSPDPDAVMFASYSGIRRGLTLDDVTRIQTLYGGPVTPPSPAPPTPPPPPVDPWNDPAIRALIDEWIQQQNRCVKKVFPGARVDQWGRLCGTVPGGVIKCNHSAAPPGMSSYEWLWKQNFLGQRYAYRVRQYIELRQAGNSFGGLQQCR